VTSIISDLVLFSYETSILTSAWLPVWNRSDVGSLCSHRSLVPRLLWKLSQTGTLTASGDRLWLHAGTEHCRPLHSCWHLS